MQVIINTVNKVINFFGYFCGVLMLAMVFNVFYDVVMRYLFNDVSIAMQELEWHLFSAMFMFGIGYTLKEDGHVRVDVIYDQLSVKTRAIINILGSVFFALPFTSLLVYFGVGYSLDAYNMNEGSADPGGLPHRWIVRSVIPLSSVFLILCLIQVILVQSQLLLSHSVNTGEGE